MRFSFAFTVVAIQWIVPFSFERGIISAAYPIMEMISAFFLGVLADRIGRKWIIVIALVASAFITFSFTLTRQFAILTVIHGLQGICAAAIITSTLALLTDYAKIATRGREMGFYDFSTIAGYAIGFSFALILINGDPAMALQPFYAGAGVAVIGAIVSAIILKDSNIARTARPSIKLNLSRIASSRSALTLIPAWFVLTMLIGVGLTFTRELVAVILPGPSRLFFVARGASNFGSATHIGIIGIALLILGSIFLGFTQSSFGSLSDRYGRTKIILIGQASILGLLFVIIGILFFNINRILAVPFVVLFGAGLLAFTPAALAELADVAPESGRGSAMGLYSLTVGAGTVFGPLAGGALISLYGAQIGLSILLSFGALIMVGSLVPRILELIGSARKDRRLVL